jgi:hypothetical protein
MRCVSLALFCLLLTGHPALAAPLLPGDFAYGFVLPVTDHTGIHASDLPPAVYEKALRADLGDLRVFNAAGEAVPHAVRRVSEESRQTRQSVPFFPLPDDRRSPTTDLSLRVARNAAGTVINVDAGNIAPTPPQPASSFLIDTTKLAARPTELDVQWSRPSGILTISLAQSSDLVHWSPLVVKAILADLIYNGGNVSSRRIVLPARPLPYIRLDCTDCREPMQLLEVTALSGTPATADQWQWLRLSETLSAEEKGARVIEYRREAKTAVTALQLGFPAANSLLRATIESRSKAGDAWRHVAQADFYHLELQGQPLAGPLVQCPPNTDTHWRLRVITDGAGLDGNAPMPKLELGWRQEQVVFFARGNGPYTLAFGSARAAETPAVQDNLVLTTLQNIKAESHIRQVEPGPLLTLGGEQALKPRLSTASWKKTLLWVVLVSGVLLLAFMTRTLYREMQTKKSE